MRALVPILTALVLAAAACGGDEPRSGAPSPPRLVMIGDSLAVGTEPYLGDLLDGWAVATDADGGRPLATGMEIVERTALGPGDVLALSLFTNDRPEDVAALRAAVRRSAERAGCVVWATIVHPPVGGRSFAAANRVLAELDAALGERMVLVPWAQTVRVKPELLTDDGVHATPAGYRARAALYADAARDCGTNREP